MGALKKYYHDEICADASAEEVGCPYRKGDLRYSAWLDGFKAALDWTEKEVLK